MARLQPRAVRYRSFTHVQHLEAHDNDLDDLAAQMEAFGAKLDRLTMAILGLALTIAGSAAIIILTG